MKIQVSLPAYHQRHKSGEYKRSTHNVNIITISGNIKLLSGKVFLPQQFDTFFVFVFFIKKGTAVESKKNYFVFFFQTMCLVVQLLIGKN